VTPISPLYMVSGAEVMAPTPITLKIPATIPSDSFAMGFFYDASSGQLEGMPLLAEGGTFVTVATEHFSSFFLSLVRRDLCRRRSTRASGRARTTGSSRTSAPTSRQR